MPSRTVLKEWTEILTPWIQVVALIAAGVFALTQYVASKRETRIERASQYLTRSGSDDVNAARTALAKREQELVERFREVLGDKTLSRAEKNIAYYNIVLRELVAPGTPASLESSFHRILRYLEEGATCAEQGLCDRETIRDGNGDIGTAFVHSYGPFVCYLRETWSDPGIGRKVERFYNPGADDICAGYGASFKEKASQAASASQPLESSEVSK